MAYTYNYSALMNANANTDDNNFLPLSEVVGSADHTNFLTALLEAKGLTAGTPEADAFIAASNTAAGDSQVAGFQNIAGLSESDTAVARGDTWGGSDDTMGRSWLEAIAAGDTSSLVGSQLDQVNQLYEQGFGRDADVEGLTYWAGQAQNGGQSIQDIARHFLASEESGLRTGYHENFGRDADQAGLDYWMDHTGDASYDGTGALHNAFDATDMFNRIVADDSTDETAVRNLLSSELGIHSTDAQRNADASLDTDGDGVADVFTDASETDVFRMMQSGDLGASEVADKVTMQSAAQYMGDYGGGTDDVGATNIHRMLASSEMGTVDSSGQWQSDAARLAMTADDYLPQVTTNADGTTTTTNQWSLLEDETQDYTKEIVDGVIDDVVIDDGGDGNGDGDGDGDGDGNGDGDGDDYTAPSFDPITVDTVDVNYQPPIESDVADTSSYAASKDAFDNAAANITAPSQDMMIRNAATTNVGGSAEGVRLKRSKKFKSGQTSLGTKQLGRQLQLTSLNI